MASTEARSLLRNCLIPAMATPVTEDFAPDAARMAARARALLGDGADGVALFGTTGEGPHFPVAQRQAALEQVIAGGLPPDRLIVAANAVALADVISLARHAVAVGAAAVLLMPPFFLRGATSEAGVERFYDAVIAACSEPRLRVILYHFPDISGFAFTPPLIRRLVERHGPAIVGIKDSGGDWAVTSAFIGAFPELAVMTGTEVHIHRVVDAGGAGTICGLGNVMPRLLRRLLDRPALADQLVPSIQAMDDALSAHPVVPACKAVIAELTGDAAWRRVMPPMSALAEAQRTGLLDRIRDLLALTQSR